MHTTIQHYNDALPKSWQPLCALLAETINAGLPDAESKVWHAHPVWFLNGNPIVGYSLQKPGVRLMFWSGADFGEDALIPGASGKFKDASTIYNDVAEVDTNDLERWLKKSTEIQWDYKNIVKHKGVLKRLS